MALVRETALVLATLTMGLIAGLFYGYACSVMSALSRTDDRVFIEVMQRVNTAIENGWFALSFIGAMLFSGLALILQFWADGPVRLWLIVSGLLLYIASVVVTVRGNIPLNVRLGAAGPADRLADPGPVRRAFEQPWVRLHLIRTLLSIGGFAVLCVALAVDGA